MRYVFWLTRLISLSLETCFALPRDAFALWLECTLQLRVLARNERSAESGVNREETQRGVGRYSPDND
jgi:hypothetical protein